MSKKFSTEQKSLLRGYVREIKKGAQDIKWDADLCDSPYADKTIVFRHKLSFEAFCIRMEKLIGSMQHQVERMRQIMSDDEVAIEKIKDDGKEGE